MNIQNSLENFDLNNLFDFHDIYTPRFNRVKLNSYVIYSLDYEDMNKRYEEVRYWVLLGRYITQNCCVGKLIGINPVPYPPYPFIIETVNNKIVKCKYIYLLNIEDNKNESVNNEIKRFIIEKREKDIIELLLLPNKDDKGYQFINLTKGYICQDVFPTMEDALKDLENFKKSRKIKNYIEIPNRAKLSIF